MANATCLSDAQAPWMFNNQHQDPCAVANTLSGSPALDCQGMEALQPYSSGADEYQMAAGNPCDCSTVFYSLVSACAVCQSGTPVSWSYWKTDCNDSIVSVSSYPAAQNLTSDIPTWAFLDVTQNDTFNSQAAEANATSPPADPSPIPSSSPTASSPADSSTSTTARKSSVNVGAIAGGVIGGVVLLALLVFLAIWLVQRRRKSKLPPSAEFKSAYAGKQMTDPSQTAHRRRSEDGLPGYGESASTAQYPLRGPSPFNTFRSDTQSTEKLYSDAGASRVDALKPNRHSAASDDVEEIPRAV